MYLYISEGLEHQEEPALKKNRVASELNKRRSKILTVRVM